MSIEIDREKLCDFCRSYHDSDMSMCEGLECEKMRELYLADLGITDCDSPIKIFADLRVGNTLYYISNKTIIPKIETIKINLIGLGNNDKPDSMFIKYKYHREIGDCLKPDNLDASKYKNFFLYKKDAEEFLLELCTKRIIEISKVIGGIDS